ncbi:MAG: hypothetical protein KGJ60_02340 [Verrucomicrobiota bacterium]|nr:hypothetical protein [Verrucomicrobiota bacterium]
MKLTNTLLPTAALLGGFLLPGPSAAAQSWFQTSAPTNSWYSIASSSDGAKLAAVAYNGDIYTSTNSGVDWAKQINAPSLNWYSIASSSDGTHLVAAAGGLSPGPIYTSTDSGATWTSNDAPLLVWASVASSADGTKLAAAAYSDVNVNASLIYLSSDAGAHWTAATAPSNYWYSIASSADGTRLAAVVFGGGIWTSADAGTNWTLSGAPSQSWETIASSSDGIKLVAAIYGGGIWTSMDAGTNWTESATAPNTVYWAGVASSANGAKLAAVGLEDESYNAVPPYLSTDSDTNWTATLIATNQYNSLTNQFNWYSVASSADGSKLAAVVNGGGIFTLQTSTPPPPTPTLNIAVSGTNVIFSWSAAATGFVLQQNASLSTGNWQDVTNPVIVTNGLFEVILPLSQAGNYFYRLSAQSTVVTSPALSIARSGGNVLLSWPATVTGFGLQQNSSLAAANWVAVTNPVVVANGQNQVTVTPSSGSQFYRLISPP